MARNKNNQPEVQQQQEQEPQYYEQPQPRKKTIFYQPYDNIIIECEDEIDLGVNIINKYCAHGCAKSVIWAFILLIGWIIMGCQVPTWSEWVEAYELVREFIRAVFKV